MSELSEGSGYLVVSSRPITVVEPGITAEVSADLETETPFPYGQGTICVHCISVLYREEEKGTGKHTAGSHSFPLWTV